MSRETEKDDAEILALIRKITGIRMPATVRAELELVLDELQLEIMYLFFELEATKRENTYLRQMLKEASGDS